jgi:hypothetical protein
MFDEPGYSLPGHGREDSVGFTRQFTGGFEGVPDARRLVAAALLRDTELSEAARPDLLHVEVHDGGVPPPLDRNGARPASVAGRSLKLVDALGLGWDSSPEPGRPGHMIWFELEA